MYKRQLEKKIKETLLKYPIITLLGPRQSGKTTLIKSIFPDFKYLNLESPEVRAMAQDDPKGLLKSEGTIILDEVQRVPELLSYIQTIVDSSSQKFILTGSHQLLLSEKIAQSLAGRTRIFELLPLSVPEILLHDGDVEIEKLILQGGYPRIYDHKLEAFEWHWQYLQTYVEKDVRQILNVGDLIQFERFIKIISGRVGQVINYSQIANDVGIKSPTAQSWVSLLCSSYITFLLPPFFQNFTKRYIKSPKLYFHDTGLLCTILGIKTKDQLETHPLIGFIFENFIVSELVRKQINRGEKITSYFYRDQNQVEVDFITDDHLGLNFYEIKKGSTFQSEWVKNLDFISSRTNKNHKNYLIYTGESRSKYKNVEVLNWKDILNSIV